MKLKKNVKISLIIIFLLLCFVLGTLVFKIFFSNNEVEGNKVISTIKDYGYNLKDNKDSTYKEMFNDLKEILNQEKVDYDEYAKKISEMFIYDFYSLENKIAKNDIGGVDFIHPDALTNFVENAESTYYKYVESNIYGKRTQSLPLVDKITIDSIDTTEFALGDTNLDDAYKITASWNYTNSDFNDYQSSATIIIVKDGKKLQIVELN